MLRSGEDQDFLRNASILHFLSQNYLPFGWERHEIYSFLSPYPTGHRHLFHTWVTLSKGGPCMKQVPVLQVLYITNLVKIGPVVLDIYARRTPI